MWWYCLNEQTFQIILSAQNGDKDAMTSLMAEYKTLAARIAKRYYISGGDGDDLLQEAMIGLYKAINSFDSKKNDNFLAFSAICINRHLQSVVKQSNRQKHLPLNSYVSLDSQENINFFGDVPDPAETAIKAENFRDVSQRIDNELSDFEKKVLVYYLSELKYNEIALKLEVSKKSVDNAVCRIKNKLKTD